MTVMNVVHMRVKPGKEDDYVRLHQEMDVRSMPGVRNLWLVRSGEHSSSSWANGKARRPWRPPAPPWWPTWTGCARSWKTLAAAVVSLNPGRARWLCT